VTCRIDVDGKEVPEGVILTVSGRTIRIENYMPRGPLGEKRPADVIGAAVMVAKIATGEIEDRLGTEGKDPAAVERGRKGDATPLRYILSGTILFAFTRHTGFRPQWRSG
jgi:hypothetical protein